MNLLGIETLCAALTPEGNRWMAGSVNLCSGRIQIHCRSDRPTVSLTTHMHKKFNHCCILTLFWETEAETTESRRTKALMAIRKKQQLCPFSHPSLMKRGRSSDEVERVAEEVYTAGSQWPSGRTVYFSNNLSNLQSKVEANNIQWNADKYSRLRLSTNMDLQHSTFLKFHFQDRFMF